MDPEIVILGAGPAGSALALLLHGMGRQVALVEPRGRADSAAGRPIALSYASRIILERAGAWQALEVTPIETIHVSQQRGFGTTRWSLAVKLPRGRYTLLLRARDGAGNLTARAAKRTVRVR